CARDNLPDGYYDYW
nr:immunoglobulin heavy chain junction region [Mus musculus]